MFSLSELLFHLQKHRCSSGQYLPPTLNSPYKSVCDGHRRASGTCEDTSAKEEESVAQWLCPAGVGTCAAFPQCWAPQAKRSRQEELATAAPDYVFSNFDLTSFVRSETET